MLSIEDGLHLELLPIYLEVLVTATPLCSPSALGQQAVTTALDRYAAHGTFCTWADHEYP
jgi:hypothetical protein